MKTFADSGCTCDLGLNKSPCCSSFTADLRCVFAEMTHDNLDLFMMGQIMANCFQPSAAEGEETHTHKVTRFQHQGHRVCQKTFLFLHNMGLKRFKNIKASYIMNGPAPRVHGNKGRRPKHQLTLEQAKDVVQYIMTYTGTCTYM